MNDNWSWLVGRRLALGRVNDVDGDALVLQTRTGELRVPAWEALKHDYASQDLAARPLSEALNTGDGVYRP
jgi:hypothetical protein